MTHARLTGSRPGTRRLSLTARALVLLYATCGLAAMWLLAPRVPYADG